MHVLKSWNIKFIILINNKYWAILPGTVSPSSKLNYFEKNYKK